MGRTKTAGLQRDPQSGIWRIDKRAEDMAAFTKALAAVTSKKRNGTSTAG